MATLTKNRCFYSRALYNGNKTTTNGLLAVPSSPRMRRTSSSSFLNISSAFIAAVEKMSETVLVPTRLMDVDIAEEALLTPTAVPQILLSGGHASLFDVFLMIQQFKDRLASMAIDDDEQGRALTARDVDETLFASFMSKEMIKETLDSGHWSHSSSGSSVSLENSLEGLNMDSESKLDSLMTINSDVDQDRLSEASFRVKQGLSSAKGLCAFLIELHDLTEFIISKYLQATDCDNA